jgi:hypothetical protein
MKKLTAKSAGRFRAEIHDLRAWSSFPSWQDFIGGGHLGVLHHK